VKVYAVVPAAGLGSRLSSAIPKILTPINKTQTIWSLLRQKLLTVVDHINIIVSPVGEPLVREALSDDIKKNLVSLSIQKKPIGMGDAVFCGHSVWSEANVIVVVWGDQVFVSENTLKSAVSSHSGAPKTVALPLTTFSNPYVEYIFQDNKLISVKESREGDQLAPVGLSDVGTFVLSVDGLSEEWENFRKHSKKGTCTGEINFLPFLPWLSMQNWQIKSLSVMDTLESRGINTREDLAFFQKIYEEAE